MREMSLWGAEQQVGNQGHTHWNSVAPWIGPHNTTRPQSWGHIYCYILSCYLHWIIWPHYWDNIVLHYKMVPTLRAQYRTIILHSWGHIEIRRLPIWTLQYTKCFQYWGFIVARVLATGVTWDAWLALNTKPGEINTHTIDTYLINIINMFIHL